MYRAYYCDGMYLKYLGTYFDYNAALRACQHACGSCRCYVFTDLADHEGEYCVKFAPPGTTCCCPSR